ncbi:MAG: hypothetical protein ACC656_00015 [Candidatus Heimdallarchaeota archaeon]
MTVVEKSLHALEKGEVFVRPTLGKICFERWKRGMRSYVATRLSDGKSYSCGVFDSNQVVKVEGMYEKAFVKNDKDKLTLGCLFVIQHKRNAILYKYEGLTQSGKVKGSNPFTKEIWTLDKSFVYRLVKDLEYEIQS